MAIAIVQRKANTGTGTTPSVTLNATPAPGNKVICVFWAAASIGSNWTDPTGFSRDRAQGSGANGVIVFSRTTLSGDSATVAPTLAVSVAWQVEAYEVTDVGQCDQSSFVLGSGVNSLQASSLTPITPDSFCVVGVGQAGDNGGSEAIDSGFTIRDAGTFNRVIVGDKIKTTISAEAPTASWTTTRNCVAVLLVYQPTFEGWGNPL